MALATSFGIAYPHAVALSRADAGELQQVQRRARGHAADYLSSPRKKVLAVVSVTGDNLACRRHDLRRSPRADTDPRASMHFNGRIVRTGAQVAYTVTGDAVKIQHSGMISWCGHLDVAPGLVKPGRSYTLELDDGQSGEITIVSEKHLSAFADRDLFRGLATVK